MGSDFTYSDVAGRQVGQDNHKLVKETAELYFIESIPKDKTDYYSSIRYIISKEKMAPLKIIFYHDNKKLKTLQNTQFQKIKDVYVAINTTMSNHETSGKTNLRIEDLALGAEIKNTDLGIKVLKQ